MDFFERYEKKMRRSNMLCAGLFLLFAVGCGVVAVAFICNGGFSLKTDYVIGAKRSNSGIPVPNIFVLILILAGFVFMVCCFIGSLKNAIKNPEYEQFISYVNTIAPAEVVGEQLTAMEKCKLAKGDLRFNEEFFFYAGDVLHLLRTKDIRNISPICKQSRYKHYYVVVSGKTGEIQIETTKKKGIMLAQNIHQQVLAASYGDR